MHHFDADEASELVREVKLLEHALTGFAPVLTHSTYPDPGCGDGADPDAHRVHLGEAGGVRR